MEVLYSIQALVQYYDKTSVDHAAVKRLLSSAKIDSLQLLLTDGSSTTLQNYVLIPRLERPTVAEAASEDGEAPATVATIVTLAEARAAADSIASSSLELEIACTTLERLLGSLIAKSGAHSSSDALDFCIEKYATLNRVSCHGLFRRHRLGITDDIGDTSQTANVFENPYSILSAVNARLRLCDLATHCLAVVVRQCVSNESKCAEAVTLSTRLLALALSLGNRTPASPSTSFSSRNSLRTALISGAIHVGKIASENDDLDVSPWIRTANQLLLSQYATSSRTQIIAAVFGGMIPICTEYRTAASDKPAGNVMMPLSIIYAVLEEQLEKKNGLNDLIESQLSVAMSTNTDNGKAEGDKVSNAAQSFLGERVVAAEEDGDEGRIAGESGYNACENFIKRQGEGNSIKDLLCSLTLAAVLHYSSVQAQLPGCNAGQTEEVDALSDGCTSNSEGHPGSIDLFDHRAHMRSFGYRTSTLDADSELEASRSLAYHRKVAVLCIEALGSWLMLEYATSDSRIANTLFSVLETVCSNAATLHFHNSIAAFDVKAALVNLGTICGSILSEIHSSGTGETKFWEESIDEIVRKSRHCVILMKSLLIFAPKSLTIEGVLTCYVSDFVCSSSDGSCEEPRRKSAEDFLLYMMSLISPTNAHHVLQFFSELLVQKSAFAGEPSKLRLSHYAVTLTILDYLLKLAFGLQPSQSCVQISIVRLCNRATESTESSAPEEITTEDDLLNKDFAKVELSNSLITFLANIMPTLKEVVLHVTSQVLNPLWKISICPGHERSAMRSPYVKGVQKSLVNVGQSVLEIASVLHDTVGNIYCLCCAQSGFPGVSAAENLPSGNGEVLEFLRRFPREAFTTDFVNVVFSELFESLSPARPVSVSLLYRLECSAKALQYESQASTNLGSISTATVLKLLHGYLQKFAGIVPVGVLGASPIRKESLGVFGKEWYNQLGAEDQNMKEKDGCDQLSNMDQCTSLNINLEVAIRYSNLLRGGNVEDIVKGILDALSSLVPLNSANFTSSSREHLSVLSEIVSQCWPMYTSIAMLMYSLLRDCVSGVLEEREPRHSRDVVGLTNTLVRMTSWRLFIYYASMCTNTLHAVCQYAEAAAHNSDFDSDALQLALNDEVTTNSTMSCLPPYILSCVRPNSLMSMVSKLLIPSEEAAVAVQQHTRAVQSFLTACKSSSIWCDGLVNTLHTLISGKSSSSETFFCQVVEKSVLNSPTMASAITGVVQVLGGHNSKLSAVVLNTVFSSCVALFEQKLLSASNDSLYRVLELAIRACASHEEVCSSIMEGSHSKNQLLADLVRMLTRSLGVLKDHLGTVKLESKETRMVVVIMGVLRVCRKGHQKDVIKVGKPKPKSNTAPKHEARPRSESFPTELRSSKRSTKRTKHEGTDRRSLDQKQKPSEKKLRTENLCTFTTTGDQFVEQHWYFCHTCGLTGSEGVCVVCAAVCHAGHDISYSRNSRFFCDCGASGGEPKSHSSAQPPASQPSGSTDSDASSERKESGSESLKRRRCICLKRDDSDTSDAPSSLGSEVDTGLETTECAVSPDRYFQSTGDLEMSFLRTASPLIGRCMKSYTRDAIKETSSVNEFESSLSSMETVERAVNISQNLLDGEGRFSCNSVKRNQNVVWNSLGRTCNQPGEYIVKPNETTSRRPVLLAPEPVARLVRVLKSGSFPTASKESLISRRVGGESPMALSSFDEHIAIGQDKGTITFFKSSPATLCKSSLERSSLPKLGEISVGFPIRNLVFHPEVEETLLVIGESSVCVITVSYQPLIEKARIDIELGLNLFDGCVLSINDAHSSPPNTLIGAEWISNNGCIVLVKTKAFAKVFVVDKDNVSPRLFVPLIVGLKHPDNMISCKLSNAKKDKELNTPRWNCIVDVLPLPEHEEESDPSISDLSLVACTVDGDILVSHQARNEWEFVPLCNVLNPSSVDGVSVSTICAGVNPGVFWIAASDGTLIKLHLSVRSTNGNPEICVRSLVSFESAFEPCPGVVIRALKDHQEVLFLFQKSAGYSSSRIFVEDSHSSLSRFSFPGDSSGQIRDVVSFYPSTVLSKPNRPGFFILLEDGGMCRADMLCGGAQTQFGRDPETVETSAIIADILNERHISKQKSRSKKVLVQERYNPVPSSIGFFEKGRLVIDNLTLSYGCGPEQYGTDSETKFPFSQGECVISSVPHLPFQFTVSSDSSAVLVGARMKFGGSDRTKNRVPCIVRVFGREVRWTSRNGYKRWLDIPFTVLESFRSRNEVVFELEPQKMQAGHPAGLDGLVAIDNLQLYEISSAEFTDRKAIYDREAAVFNEAPKAINSDSKLPDAGSHSDVDLIDLSTIGLFKTFDPRYAAVLSSIDIAHKAQALTLESAVRLSLAIGAHSLQLIHRSFGDGISPMGIMEKSSLDLLRDAYKNEFEKSKSPCAVENIIVAFSSVVQGSILTSVNHDVSIGVFPSLGDIEAALVSLRAVSRLWLLIRTELQAETDYDFKVLFQHLPATKMISNVLDCHLKLGRSAQRLYVAPKKATENCVDALFGMLIGEIESKSPGAKFAAKSLVRLFCDSSKTVRLFSTRRALQILKEPTNLTRNSRSDDGIACKLALCCDISLAMSTPKHKDEVRSNESGQQWAYRCDNCAAVCEKEWWHCMDCEDFDLCAKCVRLSRSKLNNFHSESHILVRGDREHNLDEMNNVPQGGSINAVIRCFSEECLRAIADELAALSSKQNSLSELKFFDVAQMLSSAVDSQTKYMLRVKYLEQLCSSHNFVSQVMQCLGNIVTQFDAVKNICYLNEVFRNSNEWNFAFLFLQVIANVRDSLALPQLFRSGIPKSFATILKKLEPVAPDIFRHAISCSSEAREAQETKLGKFRKDWAQRCSSLAMFSEDDPTKVETSSILSPILLIGNGICPSVSSFLQLTMYIVDFLRFALQSANGPEVEEAIHAVPRDILCDLVSSETRDPRLKGNPALQTLIHLSRKLLLVVSGKNEASMHRIVDTHIYRAHVLDLKKSLQTAESPSATRYSVQVDVANTFKSLHRLVNKRTSTWREFCVNNFECLEVVFKALSLSDSRTEGIALQLLAAACSISKGMAVESIRSVPVTEINGRSKKSNASLVKMKKSNENRRHTTATGENVSESAARKDQADESASENCPEVDWVNLCARSCAEEPQVSIEFFCRNNFAVLHSIIFNLLLQRQSPVIRTAASRILCCVVARAAISGDEKLVQGIYAAILKSLNRMPAAGALGVELGQAVEVFIAFCDEGYFDCLGPERVIRVASLLIESLRARASSLVSHPNAHIYKALANIVELQGYYLEAEPCATCSTEVFESTAPIVHRLEAIRVEAKFTDCEIMCRLISVQAINGVSVKIVDPRRTRRVKKIDVYYSPRIVSDSTELKSPSHPWRHFSNISLTPTQLEAKVDLTVPISTANLRFSFSEFYSAEESAKASGNDRDLSKLGVSSTGAESARGTDGNSRVSGNPDNLQCPRCSRSVSNRHGICRNCHENAFQCRQCRNINYENLDGFLCNECGYCKHARFEFSVTCKSSFVAEKVVCEEDRKRAAVVIEKESAEVHRRNEELKKIRSKVLRALALGPKGCIELEEPKEELPSKGHPGPSENSTTRSDIAILEALLGGNLPDIGEAIPIAVESGSVEALLSGSSAALDLSGRSGRDPRRALPQPFSFLSKQSHEQSHDLVTSLGPPALSRQSSVLAVLYTKECKSLFMAMSQNIRVLSATRQELIHYAASGLKRSTSDTNESSDIPKNSTLDISYQHGGSYPCYGCAQTFLSICIDLLYAIVHSGGVAAANIMTPKVAIEILRLSSLCEKKEVQTRIRRLIVHIVSGNEQASELVCTEVSRKIEFCIDSFASIDARSVARFELALLEDIALIEDANWEKRFRTVIQILFRASKASLTCASIAETVILPCLRIALHLLTAEDGNATAHQRRQKPIRVTSQIDQDAPSHDSSVQAPSDVLDSTRLPSNNTTSVLELDSFETSAGHVMEASTPPGDGADSVTSSDHRQLFRTGSDELSCSGAPSSIGTACEEHASDDDCNDKLSTVELANVDDILNDDHEVGESFASIERWLDGHLSHEIWLTAMANRRKSESSQVDNNEDKSLLKMRQCFLRWRSISSNLNPLGTSDDWNTSWAVRLILLAPSTQVREMASSVIEALISNEELLHLRLIDALVGRALEKAVTVGDGSREYFNLLRKLVKPRSSRLYLIAKGFTLRLANMIFTEARRLLAVEDNLNGMHAFSLSYGFVLHELVSILKLLLDITSEMRIAVRAKIFEIENGIIVKCLQQAYLFTRRLLSLRTRLTDESSKILCQLLSSVEYLFFSSTGVKVVDACVSELRHAHGEDDAHTVAVVLEQLCDMLCPVTVDPICYLNLNKAPTQDEYIRGSMSKNPYASTSFSGPLMRDVKNKICQDLDLLAFLEDDFGMELLVSGNVIKLDLSVMDVYEQVWRNSPHAAMAAASPGVQRSYGSRGSSVSGISTGNVTHPLDILHPPRRRGALSRQAASSEDRPDAPMTVIYRLAGLDGEATEPIIDTLEIDTKEDLDLETLYKSTEILGDVGGLDVLLALLSVVGSWGDDAETAVREPALKLLRACCEVSKNRSILAAAPGTLSTLLDCAASAFEHAHNSVVAVESAESLLIASEKILAVQNLGNQIQGHDESVVKTNVVEVLSRMQVFLTRLSIVSSTKAEASILHLLPFLMQGIPAAVEAATEHFTFDWNQVDHDEDHLKVARQFSTVLVAAPRDFRGQAIVLRALQEKCGCKAVRYMMNQFPMPKAENKVTWDDSLENGGPPVALKLLTGLAYGCARTSTRRTEVRTLIRNAIAESDTFIAMLCHLEMTASSNSIGSVTEELLEALREDEDIARQVDLERRNLKAARRAAAEASRLAILRETGLSRSDKTGEKAETSIFEKEMFDDVIDEAGPACVVCGDGFQSRPNEALGVYVLNRRVPVNCSIGSMLTSFVTPSGPAPILGRAGSRRESESVIHRSHSSSGNGSGAFCYTTVSQFNAIHLSCHRDAARSDRGSRREEWEGATLRNSQTICNNIFPLQPPVMCDEAFSKNGTEDTIAVTSSQTVAVEYYLARLLTLGRSSVSPLKLVLYDLGRALVRFSEGGTQVFSEHSKGGGPHSNACLLPHIVQLVLYLLNPNLSQPPLKAPTSDRSQSSTMLSDLRKFIDVGSGDIAYYLAIALVLYSASEWSGCMSDFLRLAIRKADNQSVAFRLIAFADVVNVYLKGSLGSDLLPDRFRKHIGSDESYSCSFADKVAEVWEQKIKHIQGKGDFLEAIGSSTATEIYRPENFLKDLQEVIDLEG